MDILLTVTGIVAAIWTTHLSCCQVSVPAPKNIQFIAASETNISITIDGVGNVSQYEVDVRGLYNHADQSAWIMTLSNGPTTSKVLIDQIVGLKSNRLYYVSVKGVRDGVGGNSTATVVRTAPSGPKLHLAEALPSVVSVFVDETPGAMLCEISYAKVGDERGRRSFRSETACRIATIRGLQANTEYTIRARVLKCGDITYPDSRFGEELNVSTAKLSIFGRMHYNVAYKSDFAKPSSATYKETKKQLERSLLAYYKTNAADATEVRVLQFASIHMGRATIVHHEVLIGSSVLPDKPVNYAFSTAAGTHLGGMIARVAENSYSLSRTKEKYDLNFEESLPCTAYDIRKFLVIDSSTKNKQEIELQGLSLVTNLEFEISGSEISKSGKTLYSFKNNSATVISQDYLLRTCPIGSRDLYYTRYYESSALETTPGLKDIFIHSTGPTATPDVHSIGVEYGNASVVIFKRVPNAIRYTVISGDINTTITGFSIDSSDEFWVRLAPLTPGVKIPAKLIVTTKPYDIPFSIEAYLNITTLPSSPTHVTWPYRDRFNMTLTWAPNGAALGYFVRVLYSRTFELVYDFLTEEPVAEMHNLTPGRRYLVQVIPYNYAGNATFDQNCEYSLFTDQDPPLLSIHPVNVSTDEITIQWTGGVGADNVAVHIYNHSELLLSADHMLSPTTISGLEPETAYNISVIATFETGISQSPLIMFRTDPLPPVLSPTALNTTDTSIIIQWTGGDRATYRDLRVSNATAPLFFVLSVRSPFELSGLQPNSTYILSVLAVYGRKVFESNNATFRTEPASTTHCPTTGNMTATETDSSSVDAVTPRPIVRDYTDAPAPLSNQSLVNRPDAESRNEDERNQTDTKRNGETNMKVEPSSNSNGDKELSQANAAALSEGNVGRPAESSGLAGWAWMIIGMVVTIASMGAIVVGAKAATAIMNSRAPVDGGDNSSPDNPDSDRTESSNEDGSGIESIKMETVKPPES